MSEQDFYRNERPQDENQIDAEPSWEPGGGGGGGSGGGGGDGGGGSGAIWKEEAAEDDETAWRGIDFPVLKRAPSGYLLTDGLRPELLTGSVRCSWPPHLMVWGDEQHAGCLLLQCPEGKLLRNFSNAPPWSVNINWRPGGIYTIQAKWQSGHYDYREIHRARFAAFGVERSLKLPLSSWLTVFRIRIEDDGKIFVNGVRCQLGGNQKFME